MWCACECTFISRQCENIRCAHAYTCGGNARHKQTRMISASSTILLNIHRNICECMCFACSRLGKHRQCHDILSIFMMAINMSDYMHTRLCDVNLCWCCSTTFDKCGSCNILSIYLFLFLSRSLSLLLLLFHVHFQTTIFIN